MSSPNIYSYLDHRIFLNDWFNAKKKENPRYSHRLFVRQTGQKSPSFLADIIKGRRNLTTDVAVTVCDVMKLSRSHRRFFLLLVDFHQAISDSEKAAAWAEIASTQRFQEARKLEGEAFDILSQWEHSAIHQLARRSDFRLDPQWIAKNVSPNIAPKQAKKAVEVLFGAGLLHRNAKGRIEAVDVDLVTPTEVLGLAVRNYHRSMLSLASEAMERFPSKRRFFYGITVAIPKDLVDEVRAHIIEYSRDLHALCESNGDDSNEVLQININFFPLSTQKHPS